MELKLIVLIIFLGILRYVNCEKNNVFDLRLEKMEIENTDSLINTDPGIKNMEVTSSDDKNLSKKRSFFSESSIGTDYPENFSERGLITKETNNLKEVDNNFGHHHGELNFERDRNKHSFFGGFGLDTSRKLEKLQSNRVFNHQHSKNNYDWERKNKFFEGNRPQLSESRESIHFGSIMPGLNSHRDVEKHNNFIIDTKLPVKKHPVYHVNDAYNDILNSHNFCNSDTPFIINIKTECPSTKLSKNRVMHKFVFTPKSRVRSQTDSGFRIPGHSFFDSNQITSPLYYL